MSAEPPIVPGHLSTGAARSYMEFSTIPKVFRTLERKGISKETKDASERMRKEFKDFLIMRILFNLTNLKPAGVKWVKDQHGPFLAIQTGGELDFLEGSHKHFIKMSLAVAEKAWRESFFAWKP